VLYFQTWSTDSCRKECKTEDYKKNIELVVHHLISSAASQQQQTVQTAAADDVSVSTDTKHPTVKNGKI